MRLFCKLAVLILLLCPCAFCYGQTSFSSITGEGGYAVMKGSIVLPLDNGTTWIAGGGYYRPSDKETDEAYSTSKASLEMRYDVGNNAQLFINGDYVPRRAGFESTHYQGGARYELCYHCGVLKNAYIQASAGQVFYDINRQSAGEGSGPYHANSPLLSVETGAASGPFELQLRYEKLIKYTHPPHKKGLSNWTEIPFMTAIVNDFTSYAGAGKLSYHTRLISLYGIWSEYSCLPQHSHRTAWGTGLSVHWGRTLLSGGVENFEPSWHARHKSYFFVSASTSF